MAIPNQSITVRDPGLGLSPESSRRPLVYGTSSLGTVATRGTVSNKQDVVTDLGEGPLPERLAYILSVAGGPVDYMKLTGSVAGAVGSVTKTAVAGGTGTGTVTNAAQVPYDAYEVIITIVTTGTVGTGEFTYSLDDGRTESETITIPAGSTYLIPNTNVTVTFVVGAGPVFFEAGDVHNFDCTAPYYGTADVAAAVTATRLTTGDFAFIDLVGKPASTSDGATMAAALATHGATFLTDKRYMRWIMDAGDDTTANAISDYAAFADARVNVCYGDMDITSQKAFAGWGTPKRSFSGAVAARAARALISTDLGRFPSGPIAGVASLSHDEEKTELLDQHKFSTSRTWQGLSGFYITNARFMSPAGSDFRYWQHGVVMDRACTVTHQTQQEFMSTGVRTITDGKIDERDALRIEQRVTKALLADLRDPLNAEGTQGHVSKLDYRVNRTNDVQSTDELLSNVAIQPLAYAKTITTEVGFTVFGG